MTDKPVAWVYYLGKETGPTFTANADDPFVKAGRATPLFAQSANDSLKALAERCRPAVAHDARLRERDQYSEKYAASYRPVLKAEAERAAKLLDDLDGIINAAEGTTVDAYAIRRAMQEFPSEHQTVGLLVTLKAAIRTYLACVPQSATPRGSNRCATRLSSEEGMNDEFRKLCREMAEWHIGDGDECGVAARRVLELLDQPKGATETFYGGYSIDGN